MTENYRNKTNKLLDALIFNEQTSKIGPKGDKGDRGEQGLSIKGDPGKDGRDGKDGKDGIDGKDGLNGKDGLPGAQGDKGASFDDSHIGYLENKIETNRIEFEEKLGTSFKKNIDAMGMPDFRKLAMGLRADIDRIDSEPGGGGSAWGDITGTLSNQTDLQTALNSKQNTLINSAGLAAAISDETGTGIAVFNTSPTLVTPVLGEATATSLDINGTTTTNSLIVDGVTTNTVIVDTTTFVVDAMSHNVGIGTATPAYKLTVQGGAVDFFGGYFHCDGISGLTTLSELIVNNNAAISTANITTGNITTINSTTGNIVTVAATTVGANTVSADEIFISKNQNAATQLHINNTTAGTDAVVGVIMGTDDTAELHLVVTSSLFTGFPNAAALTVNAEGGLYIENTLGDVIIEPLQEADGNGFNVNITASDGFDSGATARDGGNLVLTAGLGVNAGTDGGIKIPVIKSGATQAAAGAVANEIWKTTSHATLPDNVLLIGV